MRTLIYLVRDLVSLQPFGGGMHKIETLQATENQEGGLQQGGSCTFIHSHMFLVPILVELELRLDQRDRRLTCHMETVLRRNWAGSDGSWKGQRPA